MAEGQANARSFRATSATNHRSHSIEMPKLWKPASAAIDKAFEGGSAFDQNLNLGANMDVRGTAGRPDIDLYRHASGAAYDRVRADRCMSDHVSLTSGDGIPVPIERARCVAALADGGPIVAGSTSFSSPGIADNSRGALGDFSRGCTHADPGFLSGLVGPRSTAAENADYYPTLKPHKLTSR